MVDEDLMIVLLSWLGGNNNDHKALLVFTIEMPVCAVCACHPDLVNYPDLNTAVITAKHSIEIEIRNSSSILLPLPLRGLL